MSTTSYNIGGLTTSSDLPPQVKDILMKGLLTTAFKNVTFPLFAQKRRVPYKSGMRPVYRRMIALPNALVLNG